MGWCAGIVGNDNTRWHWGSKLGTPEPAIPWCGLMWPDGLPVSYTEAHAIAAWTKNFSQRTARRFTSALPPQLFVKTFLATELTDLRNGVGGSTYFTLASSENDTLATASLNATTEVSDNVLIEAAVWPIWPNVNSSSAAAAVGLLVRASGTRGVFVGVSADAKVVVELWTGDGNQQLLQAFSLESLPSNQQHAAVNGWNMLRIGISRDGNYISVWWNPTHADEPGFRRGERLSNVALPPNDFATNSPRGLSAAVVGGASMRLDYVSVMQHPTGDKAAGYL